MTKIKAKGPLDDILIWWTKEKDCIIKPYKKNITILPDYVWEEYKSRYGRSGRGRLWIPKSLSIDWKDLSIPHPDSSIWFDERELGNSAGIVFHQKDKIFLHVFPGHITDTLLKNYE